MAQSAPARQRESVAVIRKRVRDTFGIAPTIVRKDVEAWERVLEYVKKVETKAKEAANDELTKLPLRKTGIQLMQQDLDLANQFGRNMLFVFVDVDGLGNVNNTLGHPAGDTLIRCTAEALRSGLRTTDRVVRWGGDEFVCSLTRFPRTPGARDPFAAPEEAHETFDRIKQDLSRRLAEADPRIKGSITVGMAFVDLVGNDTVEKGVARADAAMYRIREQRAEGQSTIK